VQDQHSENKS